MKKKVIKKEKGIKFSSKDKITEIIIKGNALSIKLGIAQMALHQLARDGNQIAIEALMKMGRE